ncbi:hypothetical protein P171DRAFT_167820 [Karstenula rhodostoma CBS 690.94]|uniref:Uncharacterized protein n=1 Tax=Karstenula rhodostoma CBS 690.94 TaxID=1392251 RepID=A0A9P4P4B3_9PLEO|nr:hypothetical protein P171DRAFT_167820 [Karstenula rhodostoma CBS 690.94]
MEKLCPNRRLNSSACSSILFAHDLSGAVILVSNTFLSIIQLLILRGLLQAAAKRNTGTLWGAETQRILFYHVLF